MWSLHRCHGSLGQRRRLSRYGRRDGRRRARYRCVAAYVDPARAAEITRAGACEGEILRAPRGDGGFGYDPLFFLPALARTMAELPLDEKNQLSHRAAAFRALAAALGAAGVVSARS